MLNNAKLKETLSKKMTPKTSEPLQLHTNAVAEGTETDLILPSLTVVLTFTLSLDKAQSQMKRIQEMIRALGLQPTVQHQTVPVLAGVSQPVPKPGPATTAPASIQAPFKHTASLTPMTDKQKRMIFALTAKKALESEQVEELLIKQVGHNRGSDLTKTEASSLINTLLAM